MQNHNNSTHETVGVEVSVSDIKQKGLKTSLKNSAILLIPGLAVYFVVTFVLANLYGISQNLLTVLVVGALVLILLLISTMSTKKAIDFCLTHLPEEEISKTYRTKVFSLNFASLIAAFLLLALYLYIS